MIMKEESAQIYAEIHKIKKLYVNGSCRQCSLMEHYSRSEYNRLKLRLHGLDNLSHTNPKLSIFSTKDIQQSVAILGMYVMV